MLTTSEGIAELAGALAKAQGEFPKVGKDRKANLGTYSYAYADLADILDAVRAPLAKNGLSVLQPIVWEGESPVLVTRLVHASGQWIESTYRLEVYEKPQEQGSAITYARRYSLTSLLGIAAEEDDDGQAAQSATPRASAPKKDMPPCPQCKKMATVYQDKNDVGKLFCWKTKGGCGANWSKDAPPQTASESVDEAFMATAAPTCRKCNGTDIGTGSDGRAFCRNCRIAI